MHTYARSCIIIHLVNRIYGQRRSVGEGELPSHAVSAICDSGAAGSFLPVSSCCCRLAASFCWLAAASWGRGPGVTLWLWLGDSGDYIEIVTRSACVLVADAVMYFL